MRREPAKKPPWHDLASYLIACVLCAYLLTWAYPIGKWDLRIPLHVSGDALLSSLGAKMLIEQPWVFTNHRLGAPGELELYDFPGSDALHISLMKLVTFFTDSYGLALNAFFLLGFFLITCSALFVLRRMGLSYPTSIAGALLYAFAPHHMYRSEGHLFLASYYVIPLTVWLMMQVQAWTPASKPLLILRGWRVPRLTKAGAVAVLICILTGCSGVYYAFFGAVLMAAAGLADCLASGSFARARVAIILSGLIGLTVFVNVAPSMIYSARHGRNFATAVRSPFESELYGLKVLQMLLPVASHRVSLFNRIRNMHPPMTAETETKYSSLGAIGSIGFALLLLGGLTGLLKSDANLVRLGLLNLVSVLVGVIGGLGTVFAYFVSPQLRGYNRISIYIAFFSIAAFFLLLEKGLNRLTANRLSARARWAVLTLVSAVLLVLGFFDQVTAPDVSNIVAGQNYIRLMQNYIANIESRMPHGAMVLQLPFMTFPEPSALNQMEAYEPLNAYLASSSLHWSYGAMRGRYTNAWIADLSTRPPTQVLEYAAMSGYQGILIARFGLADHGAALESALRKDLLKAPFESTGGGYAFYDVRPYISRLRASYSPSAWQSAQANVLHPLAFALTGCSTQESFQGTAFWWCSKDTSIVVENPLQAPQHLHVKGRVIEGSPGLGHVNVSAPSFAELHTMKPGEFFPLDKSIEVPPGQFKIHLTSDAQPLLVAGDPRRFYFQIQALEFQFEDSRIDAEPSKGCYGVEHAPNQDFRWCQSQADFALQNASSAPEQVTLHFNLATGDPTPAAVQIEGPGFSEKLRANSAGAAFTHAILLPPGESHLRITTDAKRVAAPQDSRVLVFRMTDFQVDRKIPPRHVIPIS